jgi:hypothetical protein
MNPQMAINCDAPGCVNGFIDGWEHCERCNGTGKLTIPEPRFPWIRRPNVRFAIIVGVAIVSMALAVLIK